MQRVTGRTGPHSASHAPCRPGDIITQALGVGVFIYGTHCAERWVMSSWSWDTHCCVHRGLHSRGHHHPASQAVLAAGFLIPSVSPISSPNNSAVHPHLFTDHGWGVLKDWQCCSRREGSFPKERPSTESIGLHSVAIYSSRHFLSPRLPASAFLVAFQRHGIKSAQRGRTRCLAQRYSEATLGGRQALSSEDLRSGWHQAGVTSPSSPSTCWALV